MSEAAVKYVVYVADSPKNERGFRVDRIFDTESDSMKYVASLSRSVVTTIVHVVTADNGVLIIPPAQ
jgi:hypothetical protein